MQTRTYKITSGNINEIESGGNIKVNYQNKTVTINYYDDDELNSFLEYLEYIHITYERIE